MNRALHDFLRALRAAEVRVSPAEAIDAYRTAASVGFADRTLFRDALCVTLAKSAEEVTRFEGCFDAFFAREEFRGREQDSAPAGTDDRLADQPLAAMMLAGDRAALAQAMERAAGEAEAAEIRYATQRGLFTRRILDRMGLREMEARIAELRRAGDAPSAALASRLETARRDLLAEARAYMMRQYELYARPAGEQLREEFLVETRLSAVEHRDFARMHRIVRRMAKRLATRYDRRRRRAKRGALDVRRTLRRNMAYDAIPFETVWKQVRIDRPKIVVVCDVSQSVAAAARFLLLFLYSLNEVVASLRAFAFSSHLLEVSDLLEDKPVEEAIPAVLERIGFRPTDYGRALSDFDAQFMDALDRRTTILVLGDGRSNNTDPRLDLMRRLHDRAKAVVWLNPEPETFWGTGDSEMHRYRTFCHVAKTCNTVQDLERVVDDVLKSYMRV